MILIFLHFRSYVKTQFNTEIQTFQCDNGKEFGNRQFHQICDTYGIHMCILCPYTSQQNAKSERMLRTINDVFRTFLFQVHLPCTYWVGALDMTTNLLIILHSSTIHHVTHFHKLFNKHPSYSHLCVFGCLYYPHVNTTHKLQPRSTLCIFFVYPFSYKGY